MAFPDRYEPVLSASEKDAILRHYAPQVGEPLPDDRDEALRLVRRALAPRLGQGFAFYGEARPEWAPARLPAGPHPPEWRMMEAPAGREVREPPGDWITRPAGAAPTPADPDLARVLAALRLTRNVILTGPPGSGKTYLAAQAAQALTSGQGERADDFVEWVTLHPSYTYEDFVEGLRPALGPEGGPAYEVRPGVFRHVCERAARDPAHTYVLVLDEINRANLARVLGELVTLIDDEQRGALAVRLPASGERLRVPPNLLLLGTMNSADRSVALLDAALRRRFAFVEIAPRPDLLAGAVIETEEAALHLDALLACLNALILDLSGPEGRDTLIGHSYFLRAARAAPDARLPLLELAWNEQVLPLLEEIFYTRRDRLADALAPFVEDGDPLAPREIARLHGEDLVVALSRVCK
jgi:5-methylcytosine-specific restriction protein B